MLNNDRILIPVKGEEQAALLMPEIKIWRKRVGNQAVVVACDTSADKWLNRKSMPHKTLNNYPISLSDSYDAAVSIARGWHKQFAEGDFKKLSFFEDISLGSLVEFSFGKDLMEVLNSLEITLSIINEEKPEKIVVIDDRSLFNKAVTFISSLNKIQVLPVKPNAIKMRIKIICRERLKPLLIRVYLALRLFCFYKPVAHKLTLQNEGKNNNILMVSTYGVHSVIFDSVIEQLINTKNRVILLDNQITPTGLLRAVINSFFYVGDKIKKASKPNEAKKLRQEWEILRRKTRFTNSIKYKNMPIWELVESNFHNLYCFYFAQVIKYIEITRSILGKESMSIVVVADDVFYVTKAAVTVANTMKIPTLTLQHGFTPRSQEGIFGYTPVTADKIALYGNGTKNFLANNGVTADKLVITGSPRFDVLVKKYKNIEKEAILRKLGLKREKVIVFATQPFGSGTMLSQEENLAMIQKVVDAMMQFPGIQLILKLHPAERIQTYQPVISKTDVSNATVTKKANLYELLSACDLVIIVSSTVGLEAMMLNKPVIQINLTGKPEVMLYAESGAAIGVYKVDDLVPAIKGALYDKDVRKRLAEAREKFIYEEAYFQDGQASKRVADLIIRLVEESQKAKNKD